MKLNVISIMLLSCSTKAMACPCGCGSVSSTMLFADEKVKLTMSASVTDKREYFNDKAKSIGFMKGVEQDLGLSATYRISDDFSAGISGARAYDTNTKVYAYREPVVYVSYLINNVDLTNATIPMNSMTLAYSPESTTDFLINRGYKTLELSSSHWWTFNNDDNVGGGLSIRKNFVSENDWTNGAKIDRRYNYKADLGYTRIFVPIGQVGINYSYAYTPEFLMEGKKIANSQQRTDSINLFTGFRVANKQNVRFDYTQSAYLIGKNVRGSHHYKFSYAVAL